MGATTCSYPSTIFAVADAPMTWLATASITPWGAKVAVWGQTLIRHFASQVDDGSCRLVLLLLRRYCCRSVVALDAVVAVA